VANRAINGDAESLTLINDLDIKVPLITEFIAVISDSGKTCAFNIPVPSNLPDVFEETEDGWTQ
jgi:hypothetical protein